MGESDVHIESNIEKERVRESEREWLKDSERDRILKLKESERDIFILYYISIDI